MTLATKLNPLVSSNFLSVSVQILLLLWLSGTRKELSSKNERREQSEYKSLQEFITADCAWPVVQN